ncbi:uncharacterized protein EMH_0000820 [Eimeria mitis]|uniref:Uncharacterized protein n=1 Tax=Eimeria mitis TaxID=44415 RepID=U6KCZ6_9EIME|nr:uncharacterized protein EMH_0000820 [Eimeria mitis]CDJ35875.1 hypothetical protein EMH_0000820 [Eimeria mitis]
MPGRGSSPPLWRKGVGRAFFACFAILAFQAVEPLVDALEDIGATNPHPLQRNVSHDFLSAPQPTAAQWSRASAATSSEPRQGRQGRDGSTEDMNAGSSQLQPVDGEYEKTSTEDVDVVCFSRDLSGILDQTTGEVSYPLSSFTSITTT